MRLREHFHTFRSKVIVSQQQGGIARKEHRGSSFNCLLIDLANSDNVEFKLSEEASNNLTKSISPDKRLHGKSKHSAISRLIKVVRSEHYHHNNSSTVGPEVNNNLIESSVLSISDAAALENKITDSSEFSTFLDSKDYWSLHYGDLKSLCVID